MQAPRNWRTKVERYRLTGSENLQGNKSIVNRPKSLLEQTQQAEEVEQSTPIIVNAA